MHHPYSSKSATLTDHQTALKFTYDYPSKSEKSNRVKENSHLSISSHKLQKITNLGTSHSRFSPSHICCVPVFFTGYLTPFLSRCLSDLSLRKVIVTGFLLAFLALFFCTLFWLFQKLQFRGIINCNFMCQSIKFLRKSYENHAKIIDSIVPSLKTQTAFCI